MAPWATRAGFAQIREQDRLRESAAAQSLCGGSPRTASAAGLRRVAADSAGTLSYQGTHILTFGAMRDLAAAYEAASGQRLRIAGGGCDDALASVSRGDADFGGLCCRATSTPARAWHRLRVALDLKAVIAHPSVRADGLSMIQLRAIATAGMRRWSELGGDDRAIALVLRQHCPDFVEPVRDALLGGGRGVWPAHPMFVERDEQIVETVARFPGAVGVVSLVFARPAVAAHKVRLLALNGVWPDPSSPRPGDYALTGPLDLVMRQRTPAVGRFLRFVGGPAGRAILAREFIPESLQPALRDWPGSA